MPRGVEESVETSSGTTPADEGVLRTVGVARGSSMQESPLRESLMQAAASNGDSEPPMWFLQDGVVKSTLHGSPAAVKCVYGFLVIVPAIACGTEAVDAVARIVRDQGDPTGLQVVLLIQAAAWFLWCMWIVLAFRTVRTVTDSVSGSLTKLCAPGGRQVMLTENERWWLNKWALACALIGIGIILTTLIRVIIEIAQGTTEVGNKTRALQVAYWARYLHLTVAGAVVIPTWYMSLRLTAALSLHSIDASVSACERYSAASILCSKEDWLSNIRVPVVSLARDTLPAMSEYGPSVALLFVTSVGMAIGQIFTFTRLNAFEPGCSELLGASECSGFGFFVWLLVPTFPAYVAATCSTKCKSLLAALNEIRVHEGGHVRVLEIETYLTKQNKGQGFGFVAWGFLLDTQGLNLLVTALASAAVPLYGYLQDF